MMPSLIEELAAALATPVDRRPRRLLAQLISHVENEGSHSADILSLCGAQGGRAYRLGFTGPPGAGKSTLVNLVARRLADEGSRIGVIAVDPTSPFTGGAILGDRLRMTDVSLHDHVFVRSMATRGSMGGLARSAYLAADIMEAWGMDVIVFETVGVGQSEVDIVEHADTTVVILVPESGDGVQAMKAGLMEIADLFVINKADRDLAGLLKKELESAMELRAHQASGWLPPVLQTVATQNTGVDELRRSIQDHQAWLKTSGEGLMRRHHRIRHQLLRIIENRIHRKWQSDQLAPVLTSLVDDVAARRLAVHEAAEKLFALVIQP